MTRALIEVTPPGHPGFSPFPEHLVPGIRPRRPHRGFSGLGASAAVTTVAAAGAGKAAAVGASALATDIGIGAAAGPIGLVVGAVVGLVAGKLLNPQYLNVAQANATEATYVQAFNQYKTIAGQAAGRTFGLATMVAVWKGAVFAGLFPLNHNQGPQCFHEGCLALSGQPQWIDGTISGNGNATFPQAYALLQAAYNSHVTGAAGLTIQPVLASSSNTVKANLKGWLGTMAPVRAQYELQRRRRMGALGIAAQGTALLPSVKTQQASFWGATPPAVLFIDTYWMPLQQRNSPPWGVPQTALEHQILYDVADAWLATQAIPTTPFIAIQAAAAVEQAAPKVVPAAASTVAPKPTSTGPAKVVASPVVIPAGKPPPVPVVSAPLSPAIAPAATPASPSTPPAIASQAGTATTVNSATLANLNAALAAQGFTYMGLTNAGFPIYSQAGSSQTWVYSNNQLIPYASVAQVAATTGNGVSTPTTGIDANTQAIIAAAVQQGLSAQQAAAAAATNLQSQGVPVTPDVQSQLLDAANNTAPAPAAGVPVQALVLGGGVLLALLLLK